jgi:hypothetical protein
VDGIVSCHFGICFVAKEVVRLRTTFRIIYMIWKWNFYNVPCPYELFLSPNDAATLSFCTHDFHLLAFGLLIHLLILGSCWRHTLCGFDSRRSCLDMGAAMASW